MRFLKNKCSNKVVLLTACLVLLLHHTTYASSEKLIPWILVDTSINKIALMRGHKTIKTFENAAIGQSGAREHRNNGDKTTPIGQYTISWISDSKRYYKFLGINYPNMKQAKQALDNRKISTNTFSQIKKALDAGRLPPQNTALGGNLGIHGLGIASQSIHESFNWTNGCVAITDQQLDELTKYVNVGTLIIIR